MRLHHQQTGESRTLICRSDGRAWNKGDRVSIRLLLLLLLCTLLTGCGDGAQGPALDVKAVRYVSMPPDGARVPPPRAMEVGRNNELIVLDKAGRVLIFDEAGNVVRQWWMPEYEAGMPEGACQLRDGRIAIADTHYSRIVMFDQHGKVDHMFGSYGQEPGQFIYPVKVEQDAAGNLYVVEYGGNDRVQKFTLEGEFICAFGEFSPKPGGFQRPGGLLWHDGRVYIADADNHRIQVFHDDGRFIEVLTNRGKPLVLDFPYDLSLGPDGLLYVIEYGAGRLTALKMSGELVGRFGSAGRGERQMSTPWGVVVDAQKRVWIADTGNRRIVELRL